MSELTFHDAVVLARGCHGYGGGHHTDGHMDAYQHGIQTVVNVLESVEACGYDSQSAAVYRAGVVRETPPAPVDDEWHAEEADAHEAETRARAEYEARWDG